MRLAERKMNACLPPYHPLDTEPFVDAIMGAGVDPVFDQLIGSLGCIAKSKPKTMIDSIMYWRKTKSETFNTPMKDGREVCNKLLFTRNNELNWLTNSRGLNSSQQ